MHRRIVPLAALTLSLAVVGGGSALAAPAPLTDTWTGYPVNGFTGPGLGARQVKMDASLEGAVTGAWYGYLQAELQSDGNVLVSSYDGQSWGCPVALPTGGVSEGPPPFDVGADGTLALGATGQPGNDAWVWIRPAGKTAFAGAGTGTGYPPVSEVQVATSSKRTVAVWISGKSLVGAEFLPGATSAKPVVLASTDDINFHKVRMDANGNAVIVFRSIPGAIDLVQNWLIWPAGGSPAPAQKFTMDSPDDFLELGAFQVSPTGRMIVAANDRQLSSSSSLARVALFVGTTTTGFNSGTTVDSGDPFAIGHIVAGISSDGEHASVAFRWDHKDPNYSDQHIYSVNPVTGAVIKETEWPAHPDDALDFFKLLQDGDTAYASWIGIDQQSKRIAGVISVTDGQVTELIKEVNSDWISLFRASSGPGSYWSTYSGETLTTTLPHKPLNAKATFTKVTLKKSGAITVTGKITPAPAAKACAGTSVGILAVSNVRTASTAALVNADGSFSWTGTRSEVKGCKTATVTAYLQTPDSTKPVATPKKVNCSR